MSWVSWVTRSNEPCDDLQLNLKASLAVAGLMVPVGIPARLTKAKSISVIQETKDKIRRFSWDFCAVFLI